MANDEIIEGLRQALSKGENLASAMMSFYNAGYSKQEVEDSARALNQPQFQNLLPAPIQAIIKPIQQKISGESQIQQAPSLISQQPPVQIQQIASNYGTKPPSMLSTITMVVLVFALILLFAGLISLLLFKDVVTDFLGGFWRIFY